MGHTGVSAPDKAVGRITGHRGPLPQMNGKGVDVTLVIKDDSFSTGIGKSLVLFYCNTIVSHFRVPVIHKPQHSDIITQPQLIRVRLKYRVPLYPIDNAIVIIISYGSGHIIKP